MSVFLITIGFSFFNFQTSYSKAALGLDGRQLGIVTTIMYVFKMCGSVFWGFVTDRKGYRVSMLCGEAGFILYLLLAMFVRNAQLTYLMTAIYGLSLSGYELSSGNMTYKLCDFAHRTSYFSVVNIALTVATACASLITGALIDWIGYNGTAAACLLFLIPGIVLMLKVRESPPPSQIHTEAR